MTHRYSATEAAKAAGVSYRMLDYWIRVGLVTPAVDPRPGSGGRRSFTHRELLLTGCVARVMRQTPDTAVARTLWEHLSRIARPQDWPEVVVVTSDEVVPCPARVDGIHVHLTPVVERLGAAPGSRVLAAVS